MKEARGAESPVETKTSSKTRNAKKVTATVSRQRRPRYFRREKERQHPHMPRPPLQLGEGALWMINLFLIAVIALALAWTIAHPDPMAW
jgi:hypothetical protein